MFKIQYYIHLQNAIKIATIYRNENLIMRSVFELAQILGTSLHLQEMIPYSNTLQSCNIKDFSQHYLFIFIF